MDSYLSDIWKRTLTLILEKGKQQEKLDNLISVSYTHLDVYKRQRVKIHETQNEFLSKKDGFPYKLVFDRRQSDRVAFGDCRSASDQSKAQ